MSSEEFVTAVIAVEMSEWTEVQRLLSCVWQQESRVLGFVRLVADGQQRRWFASDGYRMVRLAGEPDSGTYEILIPPRLILMADTVAGDDGATEIVLRNDPDRGGPTIAIRGLNGEAEGILPDMRYPQIDVVFEDLAAIAPLITVDDDRFFAALATVGVPPVELDAETGPVIVRIGSAEGELWMRTDWDDVGPSVLTITGDGGAPVAPQRFNLRFVSDLVRLFDEPIEISVGDHVPQMKLSGGRFSAGLMAIKQEFEMLRDSVEEVIDTVFGSDSLQRDGDGDYQIKVVGVPVWGRLVDADPARLVVFSTLLTDVDGTPELFAELNDLNSNLTFVRVNWDAQIVTARVDLVASTLDPTELFTAYQRVNDAAANLTPMLNAMFGGATLDRDAERWSTYLQTIVTAEMLPDSNKALNGPDANGQWPFSSPVHVITAWNPYNIERSADENERANRDLAIALAGRDVRFIPGRGTSSDGQHHEDSHITWSLTREEAIEIGRQFRQEAVFELTAEELRLVHCGTGVATSVPRS